MFALAAGGMRTEFIDVGPIQPWGEIINPNGNQELLYEMICEDNLHMLEDRAVKIVLLTPGLLDTRRARSKQYRIVLMTRDPEASKQSWRRVAPHDYYRGHRGSSATYAEAVFAFYKAVRTYPTQFEHVLSVTEIAFNDMISDPSKVFHDLAMDGWPINPSRAAAVIDPRERHI